MACVVEALDRKMGCMIPGHVDGFAMVRRLIRRIVDGVAEGQDIHLKLVFSDDSTYHSTRLGEPDVTIVFRKRSAEWRISDGIKPPYFCSHL
jgi:hypothetical protein